MEMPQPIPDIEVLIGMDVLNDCLLIFDGPKKEFTLAEVQSLGPGSIVELDGGRTDPVRLMVNGKILGEGELVEIEGSLGVKVLRWRSS